MRRGSGRDGSTFRMERLRGIHRLMEEEFAKNGETMSLKRFLALVDWNFGLTSRTAMGYLESMKNMDAIDFDKGGNWLKKVRGE